MEDIKGMLDTEYNEAEVNEAFKEQGRQEARENDIIGMLRRGKTVKEIVDFCGYPYDQVKKVEENLMTTVK